MPEQKSSNAAVRFAQEAAYGFIRVASAIGKVIFVVVFGLFFGVLRAAMGTGKKR